MSKLSTTAEEYNCFKIKNTSVGTAMRMNETFMSPILE